MVENTIKEFFEQDGIKDILKKYENANKQAKRDIGLNIFRLVSDYYYRENFHGDILNLFLDPKSELSESKRFSHLFLEMVLTKVGKQECITKYDSTNLEREYPIEGKRRIDFVIKGHESKSTRKGHCIIIENKLYDAVDMDNQIPAYKKAMEGRGYVVDAIVYLPLSEHKVPDRSTWKVNRDEIDKIDEILRVIPAQNLIDDWLKKCSQEAHNCEETQVILKHYINLLKSLLTNEQKLSTMENLYNFLKDNKDYFNIVNTLREMLPKMKNTMFNYIIKSIKRDKCIEGYFRSNELKEIDWGGMPVIQIKNSIENDTYDALLFDINDSEWEEAYWLLFAINSDCRIVDKKDFNNLLATRPDIKILVEEGKFLPEPICQRGGYNQVLRLVAKFDFNQDGAVKDFVIDLINHIISYRKNSNKN